MPKKRRSERLKIVDKLGYPRWMDLPLDYWPDAELRDWLLGAFDIINPLERYLDKLEVKE